MTDEYVEEVAVALPAPGATLSGAFFRPKTGDPVAFVVLNGATGVPARFYRAFAMWLARTRKLACLIYDYRDFGWSGYTRDSQATMSDWGIHDQQAARDWLTDTAGAAPVWVIGHSLGAMMLGYQTGLNRIARVICVASGRVHVSDHSWRVQPAVRTFWAPGLTATSRKLGRFPARALRLGSDLPVGVYAQWRLWCTSRAFHGADPALSDPAPHDLTCPMRIVAVSDDVLCPPPTVWRLMAAYPEAYKRQHTLRPERYGLSRIGHIDVLSDRCKAVWPDIIA